MSIKDLLIVFVTHTTFQLYGVLSMLSQSAYVWGLGLLIGITTYITYRNMLKEKDSALS